MTRSQMCAASRAHVVGRNAASGLCAAARVWRLVACRRGTPPRQSTLKSRLNGDLYVILLHRRQPGQAGIFNLACSSRLCCASRANWHPEACGPQELIEAHFSSGGASPCGGQRRIQLTLPCYSSPGSAVKDTLRGSSPCCGMAPFCDVASSCPWRCLGLFRCCFGCVCRCPESTHICEMFSCVDVVTVAAFRYALRRARRTAVTHIAMGMLLQCASFIEIVGMSMLLSKCHQSMYN